MRAIFLRAGLLSIGVVLISLCACEEHHLGEYPEVQRDRLAEANAEKHHDRSSDNAAVSPTPVNFFPTQSPH